MQIAQLLSLAKKKLREAGVTNAEIDSELLLGHCLNKSRTQLYLYGNEELSEEDFVLFNSYIKRREEREPVAYIVGEREFWSLSFFVNRNVLIPRPETEFLLESVLSRIQRRGIQDQTIVDLCCGSGVIATVLAKELNTKVLAIDCSREALLVTTINSKRHDVDTLVSPVFSNLFSTIDPTVRFPLIVSNPPYVSNIDITNTLEPEVSMFEPHLALDGGKDGLDVIRCIAGEILNRLTPEGQFFMEFGADQGNDISAIFSGLQSGPHYFEEVQIIQDYSGRDRVLHAKVNTIKENIDGKTDY